MPLPKGVLSYFHKERPTREMKKKFFIPAGCLGGGEEKGENIKGKKGGGQTGNQGLNT